MRTILALLMALSMAACATRTYTVDDFSTPLNTVYSQSKEQVFDAAIDAITLLSWPLAHTDKDLGLIQTRVQVTSEYMPITIRVKNHPDGQVKVDFYSTTNFAGGRGIHTKTARKFYDKLNEVLGN